MLPYIERAMTRRTKLQHISRHLLNLFKGCYGGRNYRRIERGRRRDEADGASSSAHSTRCARTRPGEADDGLAFDERLALLIEPERQGALSALGVDPADPEGRCHGIST